MNPKLWSLNDKHTACVDIVVVVKDKRAQDHSFELHVTLSSGNARERHKVDDTIHCETVACSMRWRTSRQKRRRRIV